MYAVPADAPDRQIDVDGTLTASARLLEQWVAEQMDGRRFRLDTFGGEPDITFIRLPWAASSTAARSDINLLVKRALRDAGLNAPRKIFAIYYEGPASSCGSGELGGTSAGLYLWSQGCNYEVVDTRDRSVGFLEYVMVHELLHALGAVPSCAPHFQPGNHTNDDQRDLLYEGTPPYWLPTPVIDPGRDDYYGHRRSDCLDVADSPFLAAQGSVRILASVSGDRGGTIRSVPSAVNCSSTCETDVSAGSRLRMTAVPEPGAAFERWTGACAGQGACEVDASRDVAIGALFVAARYRVVVSVTGPGSVIARRTSCSRRCVLRVADGSSITLRAKPMTGARFVGWSGGCRGRAVCTLFPASDVRVAARFVRTR